jgi:hypothetical protein
VPQNRKELRSALHQIVDAVPDASAPDAYAAIKNAVEDAVEKAESTADDKNRAKKVESMSRTTMTLAEKVAENILRRKIRSLIREAGPYRDTGMSFSGWPQRDTEGDDDEDDDKSRRRITSMADVGGDVLQKIAGEFGRSVSGAKRLYDVSENTAKFMAALLSKNDASFDILRLHAMKDFIDALEKEGDIDQEDVDYMGAHPEEVEDLDSYRVYMSEYIKEAMRQAVDQYLADRLGEIEDYFADRFRDDPARADKMVKQAQKNPMWEVPRIPTFYEFVEDAFDLDVDAISPPRQAVHKLVASYEKAEKGRAGEE